MKRRIIMILEMCTDGYDMEETHYGVNVKCTNCGATYQTWVKKGVLVSEESCYNCKQLKLKTN